MEYFRENGIGCQNFINNILHYQFNLEDPRSFVIERTHRSRSATSPRPIHCRPLNWEYKDYLLNIAPGRLKRNLFGKDQIKIHVSDDVSNKVRDQRKELKEKYLPDTRMKSNVKIAFVPFMIPARIQYR